MKRIPLLPLAYHALTFDKSKLPDVAAAGPVSASILSKSKDPLQFLVSGEKKSTPSMEWGSLIDCIFTTPELFPDQYAVLPADAPDDKRRFADAKKPAQSTLDAISWWNDFERQAAGKIIIKQEMLRDAQSAVSMLNQHKLAMEIHSVSEKQVALLGDSPILPGTKAKCLFDFLPTSGPFVDTIPDLKTTNDISDHAIKNTCHTFEYAMKLGYYGILAEAAGLGHRPRGILIWQRSSFPYDVRVTEIDKSDMDIGRQTAINRLNRLSRLNPNRLEDHFDITLSTLRLDDWMKNSLLKE